MKIVVMLFAVIIACAGCQSVSKYKGVTLEYDAQGRQVRRVESESLRQTEGSSKKLVLKHLDF